MAERIGYPVLLRPSYVLGGRAMEVVDGPEQLDHYIATAVQVSGNSPVLIDHYLRDAIEVDVDAICDGKDVAVAGILQHIEEAGVHSGDSACSIPPYSLSDEIIAEIERQTRALALALNVKGLMNVQFAVKDDEVYLIEVNPRASRTVPFVAKAIGAPGRQDRGAGDGRREAGRLRRRSTATSAISRSRRAVFPFARFPGTDPVLSPEMKSTGEVMGIDSDFDIAFAKSQLGGGVDPAGQRARCSCRSRTATRPISSRRCEAMVELGFQLIATGGTARSSRGAGACRSSGSTRWRRGGRTSSTGSSTARSQLVFNTTEGWQSLKDSQAIREAALKNKVPYFTTAAASLATARAIEALRGHALEVRSLQSYYSASKD